MLDGYGRPDQDLRMSMGEQTLPAEMPWADLRGSGRAPARLGRYAGGGWLRRHRRLCFAVLMLACFVYGGAFALLGRFLPTVFAIPFAVLAGIAIWLLPDTGAGPRRLLRGLFFAYVVALLCWPDYLAVSLPGLPWITAIRLTGLPLALVLLITVSTSAGFRRDMTERLNAVPLMWKLVVAFAAVAALLVLLSPNPGSSLNKFLVAQMTWTAVFFAAVYVFSQPGSAVTFARILWFVVLYLIVIGFLEARASRVPWAGHIPSFLAIEDESVLRVLAGTARATTGVYRVQTRFTTSLGLAEYLAMAVPFVLHLAVAAGDRRVRLAAAATMPLAFWLVLKTDSRLALLGFLLTILLYLFIWAWRQWHTRDQSLIAAAVIFLYPVGFAVCVAATFLVGRLRVAVWGGGAQQSSTDARADMYLTGIPLVLKRPWGYGMGEGAATLGYFNGAGVLTIDTYYLAVALEYGLIGFAVYYGLFLKGIATAAFTARRAGDPEVLLLIPAAVALINFFISKAVFSNQENHSLAFMLLGLVVALAWRQRVLVGGSQASR